MRKVYALLTLGSLLLIGYSCSKSNDGPDSGGSGGGNNPPPSGNCSGTPGALFAAVRSVLQANCAVSGCHAGAYPQNGLNFSDNCTIVAQAARIKVRAVDLAGTADQMPQPPRDPLSTADRQKIVDWVNAGGKLTN